MAVCLLSREGVEVHQRGYYRRPPHIENLPSLHRKLQGAQGRRCSRVTYKAKHTIALLDTTVGIVGAVSRQGRKVNSSSRQHGWTVAATESILNAESGEIVGDT